MDALTAAAAAIAMTVDGDDGVAERRSREHVTVEPSEVDNMPKDADGDAEMDKENERPAGAHRSRVGDAEFDTGQPSNQPGNANNHPQSASNHSPADGAPSAGGQLDLASAKQRTAELFPAGATVPAVKPRLPAVVETVTKDTNDFCTHVFDASKGVKLTRGVLAREEAAGHIAADLLGIELLKEEALRLGESVRKAALAAKDADAALRNGTSAIKSKLKQKAAKDPVVRARLDGDVQRLDSDLEAARAKLRQALVTLNGLPDAKTVIVERKPKKPKPAAPPPRVDYSAAGDTSVAFFSAERHPRIKGYRGRPGGDPDERFWNPAKPPCVPSDDRPQHLFASREAAEAASAAAQVEAWAPPPFEDEYYNGEERYDLACVKHKHAVRQLLTAFPEVTACFMAHASQHETKQCPCGRGVLARWPWVVHTAQLGFCDARECGMASWELTCWRSEWIVDGAGRRDLPL